MTKTNRFLTAFTLATFFFVPSAFAQKVPSNVIPVLIVIPARGTISEQITVTRRASDGYVITIPEDAANPENLRLAVREVTNLLDRDGDAMRDNQVITIPKQPGTEMAGQHRLLRTLLASNARDIAGRKGVRATYIYLLDGPSREALRRKLRSR